MKTLSLAEKAKAIAKSIVAACDEKPESLKKRVVAIAGLTDSYESRQYLRRLLIDQVAKSKAYGAAILHMETMKNTTEDGVLLPNVLRKAGKFVISKLDTGMTDFFMMGLDTIKQNLQDFPADGVKCRYAFKQTASEWELELNAAILTQVAVECLKAGQIPMLEPEMLRDGSHSIEGAKETMEKFLSKLFAKLELAGVNIAEVIVKYAIILPGADGPKVSMDEVVAANRYILTEVMPKNIGGLVFLSGGIEEVETLQYVNAIAADGKEKGYNTPYTSFGRGSHGGFYKTLAADATAIEEALADFEHRGVTAWFAVRALYTSEIETDKKVLPLYWPDPVKEEAIA